MLGTGPDMHAADTPALGGGGSQDLSGGGLASFGGGDVSGPAGDTSEGLGGDFSALGGDVSAAGPGANDMSGLGGGMFDGPSDVPPFGGSLANGLGFGLPVQVQAVE